MYNLTPSSSSQDRNGRVQSVWGELPSGASSSAATGYAFCLLPPWSLSEDGKIIYIYPTHKHSGTAYIYGDSMYGLAHACEGFSHPKSGATRNPDQSYWKGGSIACAPEFSYAWLPELWYKPRRSSPARRKVEGWSDPTDSATRPMFRLPVLDINQVRASTDWHGVSGQLLAQGSLVFRSPVRTTPLSSSQQIQCTPSPFVNVPGNDGKKLRPRRNSINLPTLCNDEMTQAVLSLVGPGTYEADAGSSFAEIKVANDGDTVTCEVNWDETATPGVVTTNIYITVRVCLCVWRIGIGAAFVSVYFYAQPKWIAHAIRPTIPIPTTHTGARWPCLRHGPHRLHGQRQPPALVQLSDGPILQRHPPGQRAPAAHAHEHLRGRGVAPQQDQLGHTHRRLHRRRRGPPDQAAHHRLRHEQGLARRHAALAGL